MPRRSKALLDRAERVASDELAPVILVVGCPEPSRLGFNLASEREALIESNGVAEVFQAEASESTGAFHRRLVAIARERGVRVVSLGSDAPMKVARYDHEGNPITLN